MAAIDDLTTQFEDYKASVDAAFAAIDQAISDLTAELSGAGVDPTKLAALESAISDARGVAVAEQTKVAAEDPGPPAAPAPTPEPTPTPAPSPTLFVFLGADASQIDTAAWVANGQETTETPPRPLYTFAGSDPSAIDPSLWQQYTGATQPVGSTPTT
jgi:hypothetical protein